MSNHQSLADQAAALADVAQDLSTQSTDLAVQVSQMMVTGGGAPFFVTGLTVFVLACFVGYYVVWRVTPALPMRVVPATPIARGLVPAPRAATVTPARKPKRATTVLPMPAVLATRPAMRPEQDRSAATGITA